MNTYIARFTEDGEESVKEHLIEVSKYCHDFASDMGLSSFCELCGLLHDSGKYSEAFQCYIRQAQIETKQGTYEHWKIRVNKVDHGVHGAKYLFWKFKEVKGIRQWTRDIIGEVICYHHGGLPDNLSSDYEIPLIKRMEKVSDEELKIVFERFFEEFAEEDIVELFEQACEELQLLFRRCRERNVDLNIGMGFIIKYIYSCVVDADRLDSFRFESGYAETNIQIKELWSEYVENLERKIEDFKKQEIHSLLEENVKTMREAVSDSCKNAAPKAPGIYTLTVPTGGGKTFASMRFALHHAMEYEKKKIIYVMPYTTIIEQNADEIRKVLGCEQHLLEFHSDVLDDVKNDDYEILSERFTSPIIFTTMVQFLNVLFATGNGNIRKMHQFENAVIVFDEIQALPIKCTALFYQGIDFLVRVVGATCVLCTATQPDYEYIEEHFKVKIDGEIVPNVDEVFRNLKRMHVVDMTKQEMGTNEIAEFIVKIEKKAKSVLCIMNTVQSVLDIFDSLKRCSLENMEIYALTTRMCSAHRKKVIRDIKNSLKEKRKVICISTQLIEAGVDVSFEKVIRSLANLDSIAQAAGRGNRHGEREISEVYVVKLKNESILDSSDIKIGQGHAQNIFRYYSKNPEAYQYDLLSSKAIRAYYVSFYEDNQVNKKMKYPLNKLSENNLYDLLKHDVKRTRRRTNYELSYAIQFETARMNFQVIDSNTHTIVVPYNEEAKEAINIILSDKQVKEKYLALKVLQKYTVNIYENLYKELKQAFIKNNMEGVDILSEEYYLEEKGVTGEKKLTMLMY
ncbi:MAG: CRISPR-associated helicase Cas3' [Lachnospiraceae bacterium]